MGQGLCNKGRVKCAVCPNRRFLPITDKVIRWHLSGCDDRGRDFVMGLYPMFLDETCFLLAVDFDKERWREDTSAFIITCCKLDIPAAVERSRSGNGSHVWFFFNEPISASLARKLASLLLTETMNRRPDIGLDSYDRFIPNQDTLPRGGFGNLIALPLQKKPRAKGNSLFLDNNFLPHADQWAFLSAIQKIDLAQAEEIVKQATAENRVIGVRLSPTDADEECTMVRPTLPSSKRTTPDRPA